MTIIETISIDDTTYSQMFNKINTNFSELNVNKIEIDSITTELLETDTFVIYTWDELFKEITNINI